MIICKNEKCANFKQELDETLDVCPACGLETARIDSDKDAKRKLAPIISLGSIAAIILTFLLFDVIPNFYVSFFLGAAIIAGCIVLAFITKVKGAIVTTILAAAGFIGIFAYYGLFG